MHRQQLLKLLNRYQTRFVDEAGNVARTRLYVECEPNCFHRELEGHVTGSAWVVSPDRRQVLMMHHRKLDQWFQPGGHADGDADILRVALKETAEETGLELEQIQLVSEDLFDVDIHTVFENGQRHTHYDIRFLVEIDDEIPIPGNDESHQILWVPVPRVSRFNNNRSTYRMTEKTRRMRPY